MDFACLRCTSEETVVRGSTVGCRECGHWTGRESYPDTHKRLPYCTACPTGCKRHPRVKPI